MKQTTWPRFEGRRTAILPLLGGEGRGEGEPSCHQFPPSNVRAQLWSSKQRSRLLNKPLTCIRPEAIASASKSKSPGVVKESSPGSGCFQSHTNPQASATRGKTPQNKIPFQRRDSTQFAFLRAAENDGSIDFHPIIGGQPKPAAGLGALLGMHLHHPITARPGIGFAPTIRVNLHGRHCDLC